MARFAAVTTFRTCASVATVKFGRCIAAYFELYRPRRYAWDEEQRFPSWLENCERYQRCAVNNLRATAATRTRAYLRRAHTFLHWPVVVVCQRDARVRAAGNERLRQHVHGTEVSGSSHAYRAANASTRRVS